MIIVYVTYPDREQANKSAKILVERRLVACANIFGAHRSVYRWQGKLEESDEIAVFFKTRKELFEAVKTAILEHHPYECPCIVSWGIEQGYGPFLRWIAEETKG